MIGRADIEGSKSDVAMNAWPPQASYPCGNFSDTSWLKLSITTKGSIGPAFAVRIRTENQDQASFCPFALREVSVLTELALGHLRYLLTDVPPQSNSPPDTVHGKDHTDCDGNMNKYQPVGQPVYCILRKVYNNQLVQEDLNWTCLIPTRYLSNLPPTTNAQAMYPPFSKYTPIHQQQR